MASRSSLFKSNRSQAVRLPKDIAFPDDVKQVAVWREGNQRIIAPADAMWDAFFDAPGIALPERDQPTEQSREAF
jgi:antitoxin VapB